MKPARYTRYAVFYTPPPGPFAAAGAAWLGWDSATAQTIGPARSITDKPRKYGFHATLKAPFRLADTASFSDLRNATLALCQTLPPVSLDGLTLTQIGGFLALVPTGNTAALSNLAAQIVRHLDPFRAPLTAVEHAKRAHPNLSAVQLQNLTQWGYAHVMDDFRFHMTLTGRLARTDIQTQKAALTRHFATSLPHPFTVSSLTLMGESTDGPFHEIERFALGGR